MQLRKIFRRTLCLVLAASVLETSGGVAQACLILKSAPTIPIASFPDTASLFAERALVNRMVGFHRMIDAPQDQPETITLGRLYGNHISTALVGASRDYAGIRKLVPFASFVGLVVGGVLLNHLIFHFLSPVIPGVALACGNFISGGYRSVYTLITGMKIPSRRLAGRGIQSIGAVSPLPFDEKVPKEALVPGFEAPKVVRIWRMEGKKEWFFKRDNAIGRFFPRYINFMQARVAKSAAGSYGLGAYSVKLHSRFATTGSKDQEVDELVHAAQPAGLDGHWALRWKTTTTQGGTEQRPTYVWVAHSFQFNGDVNKTRRLQMKMAPDKVLGNQALRDFLVQWMNVDPKDIAPGDAPLVAMLQDLFFTQGLWGASMRYAMAIHVTSPESTFKPPLEKLRRWEPFFHHAYQQFLIAHPEIAGKSLEEVNDLEAYAFKEYLEHILTQPSAFLNTLLKEKKVTGITYDVIEDIRETLGSDLETFLNATTFAFFRNSLPYAVMYEILPRIEGTTGGDFSSTLNPPGSKDMHVTICFGQGIVATFSKNGDFFSISSDRAVQKLMPRDDAYEKLVLDYRLGEVLVLGLGEDKKVHVALYSGPEKDALPEKMVRRRLKPMNDPVDGDAEVESQPGAGLFDTYPLEAEVKRTVPLLNTIHEDWNEARKGLPSRNLQTGSELARLLIKKKIYEAIRSRIRVNERALPAQIDENLWNESERLSRDSWSREINEAQLLSAVQSAADVATKQLIDEAPILGNPVEVLKALLTTLGRKGGRPAMSIIKEAAHTSLMALGLGSHGGPLEQNDYDIILVGTEKNEYALEQLGTNLNESLGLRVNTLSGNEFLKAADDYKTDVDGFLRKMNINRKRTLVLFASDSAETFEIGVGAGWAAATVDEVFSITGGKDNRLVDIVGNNRSFHLHNPKSPDEAHLAAYAATLETANELMLFLGENVTSRFKTGGDTYRDAPFFQTPFGAKDFETLAASNDKFITHTVPEILGYMPSGTVMRDGDRDKLVLKGQQLAGRQLESVRVKIMVLSYLFLSVVLAGSGVTGLLVQHVFGLHTFGWVAASRLADFGIYSGVGVGSLMALRWIRAKLGMSNTKVLAGFAQPSILITDSYRYVHQFLSLYARTAQGLAYGINSANVHNTSTLNAVDEYKTANRRWIVLIGRPDGRFKELMFDQAAAETLGRQLKSILTLPYRLMKYIGIRPVSPEVITFGSYDPDKNDWEEMARDESLIFGRHNVLRSSDGSPVPSHVVRLYGSSIDAFTRLLGGARVLTTQMQEVAHSYPTSFPEDKSHTNTGVKSTAGPAPGDGVLDRLQTLLQRLVSIRSTQEVPTESENPVVIEYRPLISWTPGLIEHMKSRPAGIPETRIPTKQPTKLPMEASAASVAGGEPMLPVRERVRKKARVSRTPMNVDPLTPPLQNANVPGTPPAVELAAPASPSEPARRRRVRSTIISEDKLHNRDSEIKIPVSTSLMGKNKTHATGYDWPEIFLNQDGTLEKELPEGFPVDAYHFLSEILSYEVKPLSLPSRFYSIQIAHISNRTAFFKPDDGTVDQEDRNDGIIYLDEHLFNEAMHEAAHDRHAASDLLYLEWMEEKDHVLEDKKFNSAEDRELFTLRSKLRHVMIMDPAARSSMIEFMERHPVYDPSELNLAALYKKIGKSFDGKMKELPSNLSDEDREKAVLTAINETLSLSRSIKPYVKKAMALLSEEPVIVLQEPKPIDTAQSIVTKPALNNGRNRVVAHGDVHGELDGFREDLHQAGIIDGDGHWSGENAVLVQVGDVIDQGPKQQESIEFLRRLQAEAIHHGGRVDRLIGNHELMLLQGLLGNHKSLSDWINNLPKKEKWILLDQSRITTPEGRREAVLENPLYKFLFESLVEDIKAGSVQAAVVVRGRLYIHAGVGSDIRDQLKMEIARARGVPESDVTLEQMADGINQVLKDAIGHKDFSHTIFDTKDGVFWTRNIMKSVDSEQIPQVFGHTPNEASPIVAGETGRHINVDVGLRKGGRGFFEVDGDGNEIAHRKQDGVWVKEIIKNAENDPASESETKVLTDLGPEIMESAFSAVEADPSQEIISISGIESSSNSLGGRKFTAHLRFPGLFSLLKTPYLRLWITIGLMAFQATSLSLLSIYAAPRIRVMNGRSGMIDSGVHSPSPFTTPAIPVGPRVMIETSVPPVEIMVEPPSIQSRKNKTSTEKASSIGSKSAGDATIDFLNPVRSNIDLLDHSVLQIEKDKRAKKAAVGPKPDSLYIPGSSKFMTFLNLLALFIVTPFGFRGSRVSRTALLNHAA